MIAPDVPEPFLTLEMIYEEMEDEEKRFQVCILHGLKFML